MKRTALQIAVVVLLLALAIVLAMQAPRCEGANGYRIGQWLVFGCPP